MYLNSNAKDRINQKYFYVDFYPNVLAETTNKTNLDLDAQCYLSMKSFF